MRVKSRGVDPGFDIGRYESTLSADGVVGKPRDTLPLAASDERMPCTKYWACLLASLAVRLWAQPVPAEPAFEVAAIKRNLAGGDNRIEEANGTLSYRNVSPAILILKAYEVQPPQIAGPSWLYDARYDLDAKYPPGTGYKERCAMLRTLLAERFHLIVHREMKDLSGYRLVVGKGGPKLRLVDADPGGMQITGDGVTRHYRSKTSIAAFAFFLSSQLHVAVADQTGISGTFDLALDWSPDGGANVGDGAAGPSVFTAVQDQLGLKLESAKVPTEMLVVDRIDRVPTEN